MPTIGAHEAKIKFSQLLRRVAQGETFIITKHGTSVAVLAPISPSRPQDVRKTIAAIREFRKGKRLGNLNLKDLITEGRM